jgi:class 3 adenylate cyclase/tetratricopeptide (TPR) repeat protein
LICSSCGTANPAGAKFCTECATRLAVACPACGTANAATAKFCAECATPLGAGAVAAPGARPTSTAGPAPGSADGSSEPVAERRLVSVLFADLVGFTPFAEERDAEDVRETLTRYFDLASEVITRYGGTVEKFIGDAVMAVWGAPTTREDDAERAVRAALELVDAVQVLGPTIGARAGVLTGEAAVTLGATNQGMVAGDLVNTASRLQSVASPGTVLVGEATQRAASKAIAFEAAGDQVLKGKAAPVPAWRALRVVAEVGGRNRAEGLEAPFVGREEEFRLLRDLFHATGRERRVRLISVTGPAGIGKSRLAWEFLKYIDGVVETVYWHAGRCPAYGQGVSFWALGEMVRGRCGLLETDDEPTTRAKVATTVGEWITDEAERRWVEPALLTLLGLESGTGSDQLFAAWRTFFERIAARGTVAMVFEDLHFADSGLLDFIDHLLTWSKGLPIYIVTLARPELLEKRSDWGAGKRNFVSLSLDPLPVPAMRQLLAGLVPGLPEEAVRAIVARADGIPLYAVETVRMLLAEGRLTREDDVFVPVGDLTRLAVPETLTALIAARLDALDPTDRALVQDGAVLGQSFTPAALSAVSGVEVDSLEPHLTTLVRRELLVLEADPRSPERGQYAFVQALIREVAYNTLARKDRKARHLAAARFFETVGTDELVGALASHYLAAHANAAEGPEAAALAGQARIALRAAAERAAGLGAHDQAVRFYEQAVTVTDDAADRAEFLEAAGGSATASARYEEAETFLRRALELRVVSEDRRATAAVVAKLGRTLLIGRRTDAAFALLEPASVEYADLAGDPVHVAIESQLARAFMYRDEHRPAAEVADRVLEVAEHLDLVEILAETLLTKGGALASLGRLREGIGIIRVAEEIARERGLHDVMLSALNSRGFYLGEIDLRAALDAYREGLPLGRRLGQRARTLGFINNIGYTGFLTGDWDASLAELDDGLADDLDRLDRLALLSNALIIRVSRGEAVDDGLRELEVLLADETDPGTVSMMMDARASAALAEGRDADARSIWRHIADRVVAYAPAAIYEGARGAIWTGDIRAVRADLERLDATGFHGPVVEVRRTTLRAAVAALEGRTADAIALYRDALRRWRELGIVWDEILTSIDMATVLDPTEPEVREAAGLAREQLVRLRARPFLERLDACLARGEVSRSEGDRSGRATTSSSPASVDG